MHGTGGLDRACEAYARHDWRVAFDLFTAAPWATFLYTVSLMHCMTVSLSAGGEGLGTVWGRITT